MTKAQANEFLMVLWFVLGVVGKLAGLPLWWVILTSMMAVWRGICVVREDQR
jgi:hypothetical protein